MCMEIKQCKSYNCDNVMYLGGHISHYQYLLNIGKKAMQMGLFVTKGIVH